MLWGSFLSSGRPRVPGKAFKNVRGDTTPQILMLSRSPGAWQTSKKQHTKTARLLSGTQPSERPRW
jgi:hypothetical protein